MSYRKILYLKDKLIDNLCRQLKKLKSTKKINISYRQDFSDPVSNNDELLTYVTQTNEIVRNKTKEDYECLGVVFTMVLKLEAKLDALMLSSVQDIDDYMLGTKIKYFKKFVKKINTEHTETDLSEYVNFYGPLEELKNIRNKLAHDLYYEFKVSDIKKIDKYVRGSYKSYELDNLDLNTSMSDRDKAICTIGVFIFVFEAKVAFLQHLID